MQGGSKNSQYQMPALDGLRGLAAIIVILSHTSNVDYFLLPFLDFSGIGKSGVYLFFMLSSFLLTLPLLYKGREIFTPNMMRYYWARRFFRVFPLYTLYLTMALVSSLAINAIWGPKLWAIPFQLNLYEYFNHLLLQQGKSVTWSVAVEFKYYFLLPVVAYLFSVIFKLRLVPVLLTTGLSLVVLRYLYPNEALVSGDAQLGSYIGIFLLGAALAVLQFHIREGRFDLARYAYLIKWCCYSCCVLFILLIPSVYSVLIEPVPSSAFFKHLWLFSGLWGVFLFSLVNGTCWVSRWLSSSSMRFCGNISFSAYLFHPIFIDLMRHFKFETPFNAWLVFALTLLTATLSFKVFEHPISKLDFDFLFKKSHQINQR